MTSMTELFIISWLVVGAASHIWWWTKDHDYTASNIIITLFAAISGPISFVIGWTIHGEPFVPKILIRKREKK